MGKHEKSIVRLKKKPSDYEYDEARILLTKFGYEEIKKGKTSGSRVMFYRKSDQRKILLHKPHPSKYLKQYAINYLIDELTENGDLK